MKGLNVVGTGDALHPVWLRELGENLGPYSDSGLYVPTGQASADIYFVAQTEVATVHMLNAKARRIHHVILMPSLEVAHQLRDVLRPHGNLESDGRPVLTVSPAELVERVLEVSSDNFVFPAHAWTPWWSIFGAFSGVDTVEECYEDQSRHIYGIETGLSSHPPMNWRISRLDKYVLLSSSDAHSPYPHRIGREAVVFELKRPSYAEMIEAIKTKDRSRFKMTIEVPPEYGKYHWSGHRNCNFGPVPPEETKKLGFKCPVCGRKLTKGVDDRVEELADRPPGRRPDDAFDWVAVLPLQELIAVSLGMGPEAESRLMSARIWKEYLKLIQAFGNEFNVLLEAGVEEIGEIGGRGLASLIQAMRQNRLRFIPGYDGVYGRIVTDVETEKKAVKKKGRGLEEYC